MSGEDNSWRTPSFRQNVVQKIEEAVRNSGMNPSKNSLEMENHVFQKAKSKEDYLSYVARLILHVREMDGSRFSSFLETKVFRNHAETPEEIKEKGNKFFTMKMYDEALIFYDKAILLSRQSTFFGNRSACYMMMGDFKNAVKDANISVDLDPSFSKGYARLLKCHLALGEIEAATGALDKILSLETSGDFVQTEKKNLDSLKASVNEINKAVERKDYSSAIGLINQALIIAHASVDLRIQKAECLIYLKRFDDAKKLADELGGGKSREVSLFIAGLCYYYEGNIDHACSYFRNAIGYGSSNPKVSDLFKKAMEFQKLKAEGNTLFAQNQFTAAFNLYSRALQIDPTNESTNSKLFFNRGTVNFKLNQLKDAVADYTKAIELDNSYIKALSRRGQCYVKLTEYEKAVFDFEKVYRADANYENKRQLDDAKAALNKSKRKDYYKILGVEKAATADEIKKAYRKRALVHHPDRHVNSSENEKLEEEKKFKEVGEAYAVLSDVVKRADYDKTVCFHMNVATAGLDVSIFLSRATSFLAKGFYHQAREAAVDALSRDPGCIKAYQFIIKCHIAMGDVIAADGIFAQVQRMSRFSANRGLFNQDFQILERLKTMMKNVEKYMMNMNYVFAARVAEEARKLAPASEVLKLWKAECLIFLKKFDEAKALINPIKIPENSPLSYHLTYVKGLSCYGKGELDLAISMLTSCKAKPTALLYVNKCEELAQRAAQLKEFKLRANQAYTNSNFKEALTLYSRALYLDRSASWYNSIIYANRAAVYYQLQKRKECISDCSEALKLNPFYQKPLLRRAQCHFELNDYARAAVDYEKLYKLSKSQDHKDLYTKARSMLPHNASVIIDDDEEEDEKPQRKQTPRQTKINEFVGRGKRTLRSRAQKNYKIDSGSEGSESSSEEEVASKRKRKAKETSSESSSETSDEDEPVQKSESSNEELPARRTRATRSTNSSKKDAEKTKSNAKKAASKAKGKSKSKNRKRVKCDTTSESESSNEVSEHSSSSENSDSSEEDVFVKKPVGGKKSKASTDSNSSDDEDLSKIKNSYKTRVIKESQSRISVQRHKYKKVVGGNKKK